jgi:hypothetical protein
MFSFILEMAQPGWLWLLMSGDRVSVRSEQVQMIEVFFL